MKKIPGLVGELIRGSRLTKPIAKKIADACPEIESVDGLIEFVQTEVGEQKLKGLLHGKSWTILGELIKKKKEEISQEKPQHFEKARAEFAKMNAEKITEVESEDNDTSEGSEEEVQDESQESIVEHLVRNANSSKDGLFYTLCFYGLPEAMASVLSSNLPWLRDFFGLFQMACSVEGKGLIVPTLSPKELRKLNRIFLKEYGSMPLPDKIGKEKVKKGVAVPFVQNSVLC
ncbi:MAG: hypothetical protein V1819_03410 [bacterium]